MTTVLQLSFSGSVADSSPSAHPMSVAGGAHIDTNNLRLVGPGSYLYTPDSPDFAFGNQDFSIALQIKAASLPANSGIFAQYNNGNGADMMELTLNAANGFRFVATVAGAVVVDMAQSNAPLPLNTLCNLTIQRVGTQMQMLRDGVVALSAPISAAMPNGSSPLYFGYAFYTLNQSVYLDGWLDEIAVNVTPPPPPPPPPVIFQEGTRFGVSKYAPLGPTRQGQIGAFLFVNTIYPATFADLPMTSYPAPGVYTPQSWIDLDVVAAGCPAGTIAVQIGGIIGMTMGNANETADLHIHLASPVQTNNNYIFQADAVLASQGVRQMETTWVGVVGGKIRFAWWCSSPQPFDYPNHACFFFNLNLMAYIA